MNETVRYDPLTGALHHDRWVTMRCHDGSVYYFNAGWIEFLRWPPFEYAKIVFEKPEPKPVPRQGFLRRWLNKFYGILPGSSVVEQETENLRVGGSTPPRGTKNEGLTMYPK